MQKPDSIGALHRYADALIDESARLEPTIASRPTPTTAQQSTRQLRLRARVGLLAAVLVVGNVGLAAASDSAIPGDLLYPIDRGYETLAGLVGIDTGGSEERIEEAYELLANGDVDEAISAATEAMPPGSQDERAILDALATEIGQLEDTVGSASSVNAAVGRLLEAVRNIAPGAPPGQDQATKDEIRDRASAVAEAARDKPATKDKGPKAETDRPQDSRGPADGNKGGKDATDDKGNGNAGGGDKNQGVGNGAKDNPGRGNGQGKGKR